MEQEEQTMSCTQLLELTSRNLLSIRVPAGLINDIGIPIVQAVNNIGICIQAFNEKEKAMQEAADAAQQAEAAQQPTEDGEAPEEAGNDEDHTV